MIALEVHSIQPLAPVTVQCTLMEPCVTVSLSLECNYDLSQIEYELTCTYMSEKPLVTSV